MNIQEYISSGIVEAYVLGIADAAESAEFERMCAAYPEVRAARDQFEFSLEQQAMANAVVPMRITKSKIFSEVDVEMDRNSSLGNGAPVFTIDQPTQVSRPANLSWQRYLAAASVILLIGSTALNLYFFNRYRDYSERYNELVARQTEMAKESSAMQTKMQQYEQSMALLSNPNMVVVRMPGTAAPSSPDPRSVATVYWDANTKDVYLLVNKLPPATSEQQYQLWAIVDGKPVDAGVFDLQAGSSPIKMKNMPKADVFAITLEKRGGVASPEGPIYVLGKV